MTDTIIRIGGEAGDGVDTTGALLAQAFSRNGYHVNAYRGYQSVIRGGHSYYNIRASTEEVPSVGDGCDVVVAIDHQTAEVHADDLRPNAVVVHDGDEVDLSDLDLPDDVQVLSVPANAIAKDLGHPVVANTVALGAVCYAVGLDLDELEGVIRDRFGDKGQEVIDANHDALRGGHDAADEAGLEPIGEHPSVGDPRPLMSGNDALSLGAMAAGLGYYAAYPMTPASSILHTLADVGPDHGVVVKQMEDEIGVINSAIGAAWAGTRAMVATSGGGFALMSEAMGMAGIMEVPLVVVNSMRGGPSTGLPTKTEQGDLFQMLGASQGDYPKVIIAPTSPEDAYELTAQAHDLAERYQLPVMLAMDLYVSETNRTVDPDAFEPVTALDRGPMVDGDRDGEFLRYEVTDSGVSPRSIPGQAGTEHIAGSDEHDEAGDLVSDVRAGLPEALEQRRQQMSKRMRKLETLLPELPDPEMEGDDGPVLVCWGSTAPILREARRELADRGLATRQLTLRALHPFQTEAVTDLLEDEAFVVVEANYSGQLEDLVRMRTGLSAADHVRRFDGEPFTPVPLADDLQEAIK